MWEKPPATRRLVYFAHEVPLHGFITRICWWPSRYIIQTMRRVSHHLFHYLLLLLRLVLSAASIPSSVPNRDPLDPSLGQQLMSQNGPYVRKCVRIVYTCALIHWSCSIAATTWESHKLTSWPLYNSLYYFQNPICVICFLRHICDYFFSSNNWAHRGVIS